MKPTLLEQAGTITVQDKKNRPLILFARGKAIFYRYQDLDYKTKNKLVKIYKIMVKEDMIDTCFGNDGKKYKKFLDFKSREEFCA